MTDPTRTSSPGVRVGLRHPDPEERRRTAAALDGDAVSDSLAELYPLLDDSDWRVRREVALALSRVPSPEVAMDPLLDAVERGDVSRRNAAIEALRHIGSRAESAVLARLAKATGSARRFLVEVLADAGTAESVPVLRKLLHDDDANVPPAAAEVLGRVRGAAAADALREALAHPDPVVRLAALQAFTSREERLRWDELAPLLGDPLCKRAALRASAGCDDPRAIEAAADALVHGPPAVAGEGAVACVLAARAGRSEEAKSALRARGADACAAILVRLAERSAASEVRSAAISCLGLLGHPAGVGVVLRATEQPETAAAADGALDGFDADAVAAALEAARSLGALGHGALLRWAVARAKSEQHSAVVAVAWRVLQEGDGGSAAAHAIAALGDETRGTALLEWMRARLSVLDPNEYAQVLDALAQRHESLAPVLPSLAPWGTRLGLQVAASLARAGRAVPLEPLREALSSPEPSVRASAVRALAALSKTERAARDALEFALADEDPRVQAAAAEALGDAGAGRELLEHSLLAADPRVRIAAARALGRRAGSQTRALLGPLLEDPDAGVVLAALEGLADRAGVDDLRALAAHREPDVAADALARLRDRDKGAALEVARGMIEHPAWSVRLEVIRSLDARDEGDRATLLARVNAERDELVREALEEALGHSAPASGRGAGDA